MVSRHYRKERYKRQKIIREFLHGDGRVLEEYVIDRGHPAGPEVHSITDEGVILIRNQRTGKLVTKLIARPYQVERCYRMVGKKAPRWLLDLARWHTEMLYNLK